MNGASSPNATFLLQTFDNGTYNLNDGTTDIPTLHTTVKSKIPTFEETVRIVIPIVFAIIIVVGFVGNSLVIAVVAFNKTMRNSTNMLVVTLAIADLSFLAFCVPFTAYKYTMPVWIFGELWCKVSSYMTFVCCSASIYTLVLMSLDRLFAVAYAINYPNIRQPKNVGIAISIVCTVIFLANIPALLHHGIKSYDIKGSRRVTCMLMLRSHKDQQRFFMTFMGLGFILPVVLISLTYGLMLYKVRQLSKGGAGRAMNKAKRKVTLMCITVVVVFIFCWLPVNIILILRVNAPLTLYNIPSLIPLQMAANCLAYMNSCLNPILYNITSSVFRKAFKNALGCQTCRGKGTPLHGRQSSKRESARKNLVNNAEDNERMALNHERKNNNEVRGNSPASQSQLLDSNSTEELHLDSLQTGH